MYLGDPAPNGVRDPTDTAHNRRSAANAFTVGADGEPVERSRMWGSGARCAGRAAAFPMTGERGMIFTVHNRTGTACVLAGYPHVQLLTTAGVRLPFRYARGGGPYVTRAAPRPVVLPPGGEAYLLVAKYRCDLGYRTATSAARWTATRAVILLPGQRVTRTVEAAFPANAYGIALCPRAGDAHGNLVAISPVERTVAELVGR